MRITPADDPGESAARITSAEQAGATWWLELLMPEAYGFSPSDPAAYDLLRRRVL